MGDPDSGPSNVSQGATFTGAAQLGTRVLDVDACREGVLALPESLDPIERASFIALVAETRREIDLPAYPEGQWNSSCRRPYPEPLAQLAGRIIHLRLDEAGYGHGAPDEAHD